MGRQRGKVKELLDKATESALLAVEIYNKPTVGFRSGAFIVLMVIAWNALLLAIMHKRQVSYYEREKGNRFMRIKGEKKVWSISKLVSKYFTNENDPVRKNLEFFVPLRDRLEHCNYPELDEKIFGECQALLMNFEETFEKEFQEERPLRQNLVFALQFSRVTTPQQQTAIKRKLGQDVSRLLDFIETYRDGLGDDIWNSQRFSFRAFLVPKVSNNRHSNDLAVQFVKYDPDKPEEMAKMQKLGVLIKEKVVEVPSQDFYKFKPGGVASRVARNIGRSFSIPRHTKAWAYYDVRPAKGSKSKCERKYCCYDEAHKDHVYSEKWIEFLTQEMKDPQKYETLRSFRRTRIRPS